jgi:hypothetical protein
MHINDTPTLIGGSLGDDSNNKSSSSNSSNSSNNDNNGGVAGGGGGGGGGGPGVPMSPALLNSSFDSPSPTPRGGSGSGLPELVLPASASTALPSPSVSEGGDGGLYASLPSQTPASAAPAGADCRRCCRVVLGGAGSSRGLKPSLFSRTACDSLRCIECNFAVKVFVACRWAVSADYMFFRNHMPCDERLSGMLRRDGDSAAYCCQCSWTTAEYAIPPSYSYSYSLSLVD